MGTVTTAVLERGRRYAATWYTDISDPAQMARLRARICAVGSLLGLVALLISMVASPATYAERSWPVVTGIVVGLLIVTVVATARRERMGDGEFTALLAYGQVYAVFAVAGGEGSSGEVAKTALNLIESTMLGAVFIERRRLLPVLPLSAVALLVAVATRASPADNPGVDASTGSFALLVVVGVVRLLRDQAISALRQARQRELTDPLTGLTNRRGLERIGGLRWSVRAREHLPITIVVIDVDHFKQINDVRGHAAGDEILRRLAETLSAMIRPDDLAVRLGGEEFMVLCSVPLGQAQVLAELIRAVVERDLAPITISIGVHETHPVDGDALPESLWSAVDLADQALYVAKKSGRNRVMVSGNTGG